MAWYPGAVRKPIRKNFSTRKPRYDAVIFHTDAGNARDLFGWWNHADNDGASSHFHIAKDGTIFQYVDTAHTSWTSGEGSSRSIGVETQGYGTEPWTDAQITSIMALIRWCNKTHGIPIRAMNSSRGTERGIGWHRLGVNGSFPAMPSILAGRRQRGGGETWSKAAGKVCPGTARIRQIPMILKLASEIEERPVTKTNTPLVGDSKSIWPEKDLPLMSEHTKDSHNAWGRLMLDVGISGGPLSLALQGWLKTKKYYDGQLDGQFGPLSIMALQRFLKERGHYQGAVDGARGPLTVQAEISYLNDQRRHYTKPKIEAPSIVPTKEDEMTPEQMNEVKKHITAEVERIKERS